MTECDILGGPGCSNKITQKVIRFGWNFLGRRRLKRAVLPTIWIIP